MLPKYNNWLQSKFSLENTTTAQGSCTDNHSQNDEGLAHSNNTRSNTKSFGIEMLHEMHETANCSMQCATVQIGQITDFVFKSNWNW